MPCYRPLAGFQLGAGTPLFFGVRKSGARHMLVPCGSCVGCRLERARQWALRCVHEAQLHAESCFLTLTYDDAHLPEDLSLDHTHFQLFFKRLRERRVVAEQRANLRYFMCGEYGSLNGRPHYHALVFGFSPTDKVFFRRSDAGFNVYSSEWLNAVWSYGSVFVGDVSFESAGYIARYGLKKAGCDGKNDEILDVDTGMVFRRQPEYCRMSLKPGIGALWFAKFGGTDVCPHDRVVSNGVVGGVPRYYDKLLEQFSPLYLAENKAKRVARADAKYARLLAERPDLRFRDVRRLDVEEVVKVASIKSLRRS